MSGESHVESFLRPAGYCQAGLQIVNPAVLACANMFGDSLAFVPVKCGLNGQKHCMTERRHNYRCVSAKGDTVIRLLCVLTAIFMHVPEQANAKHLYSSGNQANAYQKSHAER